MRGPACYCVNYSYLPVSGAGELLIAVGVISAQTLYNSALYHPRLPAGRLASKNNTFLPRPSLCPLLFHMTTTQRRFSRAVSQERPALFTLKDVGSLEALDWGRVG